jgi:hypothetical protein
MEFNLLNRPSRHSNRHVINKGWEFVSITEMEKIKMISILMINYTKKDMPLRERMSGWMPIEAS